MSTPEESPAQRAARLRRERREAKIKEGGSSRLDKITNASGRAPQSAGEEATPSSQPARAESVSPAPPTHPMPSPQPDMQSPEALQAQQEYLRAMLRQPAPAPEQGPQAADVPDPTMKLLNSLLGAVPGDANAAGQTGMPGPSPGFSPADIASALGLPPSIASLLGGAAQPPTPEEQKRMWMWKVLHIVFALGVAVYLVFIIGASVATFGSPPPKPPTVQNPFVVFVTGEMLLTGSRTLLGGKQGGLGMAVQLFRDIIRDGSLVLFVLGMASWYYREWQTVGK